MHRKAIIVCLDGCGPEYLHSSEVPFLKQVGEEGYCSEGNSVIPSVTNVNAVSILTGRYPEEHGITTNYYFDRKTGQEVYLESPSFIKTGTLLDWGTKMGLRTALLSSKDKLRPLLDRSATISFSAEKPLPWVMNVLGPPPPIYSVDVDIWLIKALGELIRKEDLTLVYVMTTDYTMHKYAPEEKESKYHMEGIDQALQETMEILDSRGEEVLLCVTADHGMSEKDRAINLKLVLRRHGISAIINTVIADRYVVHHSNLGGAVYVYLKKADDASKCFEVLKETEGIESVLPRDQASKLYHLDQTRIGDSLVLGKKNYVIGPVKHEITEVSLRSHGSLHERRIPIIINQPQSELEGPLCRNIDIASVVINWCMG